MEYNNQYIKGFQLTYISPLYDQMTNEYKFSQPGLFFLKNNSNHHFFELLVPEFFNPQDEMALFLLKISEEIKETNRNSLIMFRICDDRESLDSMHKRKKVKLPISTPPTITSYSKHLESPTSYRIISTNFRNQISCTY
jgi:hypothetical protein